MNTTDTIDNSCIYGMHAVQQLVAERSDAIDKLYFDQSLISGKLYELLKDIKKRKISYVCVPATQLDRIASTMKHQGIVALCAVKAYDSLETFHQFLADRKNHSLLVLPSQCEDPRNLGAIIRSCVAFGAQGMLVERKGSVLLSSSVAKSAAGTLEHLRIVKPQNLEKEIQFLKTKDFRVVGASMNASKLPQDIDFNANTILILGGEHRPIPPYLSKLCDLTVSIPMAQNGLSLNVSAAASILLYECSKQRNFIY